MSLEIRICATDDTPHYLGILSFSRDGDKMLIQVVDHNNYEKARFEIHAVQFNNMVDMLLSDVKS